VLLLLGLMIAETGFGLFAEDVDGEESGALARFVSYETADWARGWHALLFNAILAVVALHVLAILFYLVVKRDNLVGPMVTGRKSYKQEVAPPLSARPWRAIVAAVIAAALALWVSRGLKI
jgi:cytochrome b